MEGFTLEQKDFLSNLLKQKYTNEPLPLLVNFGERQGMFYPEYDESEIISSEDAISIGNRYDIPSLKSYPWKQTLPEDLTKEAAFKVISILLKEGFIRKDMIIYSDGNNVFLKSTPVHVLESEDALEFVDRIPFVFPETGFLKNVLSSYKDASFVELFRAQASKSVVYRVVYEGVNSLLKLASKQEKDAAVVASTHKFGPQVYYSKELSEPGGRCLLISEVTEGNLQDILSVWLEYEDMQTELSKIFKLITTCVTYGIHNKNLSTNNILWKKSGDSLRYLIGDYEVVEEVTLSFFQFSGSIQTSIESFVNDLISPLRTYRPDAAIVSAIKKATFTYIMKISGPLRKCFAEINAKK